MGILDLLILLLGITCGFFVVARYVLVPALQSLQLAPTSGDRRSVRERRPQEATDLPAVPPIPKPVIHKCEIRTYRYADGKEIHVHTEKSCSKYQRPLAECTGLLGRSLHPGGLAEMRGGSHMWETKN